MKLVSLKQGLWYSPSTGRFFSTRDNSGAIGNKLKELKRPRSKYVTIRMGGRDKQGHRIAYEAINGRIPAGHVIDHINGNPRDNRIANLRACTHIDNCRSQKLSMKNSSGFQGVCWHKGGKKWFAQIHILGKCIGLGLHTSREDAHAAYLSAKVKYHGRLSISSIKATK